MDESCCSEMQLKLILILKIAQIYRYLLLTFVLFEAMSRLGAQRMFTMCNLSIPIY